MYRELMQLYVISLIAYLVALGVGVEYDPAIGELFVGVFVAIQVINIFVNWLLGPLLYKPRKRQ